MKIPSGAVAMATLIALTGAACGEAEPFRGESEPSERARGAEEVLEVYAVNYPLAYFAERIGGDRVRVELPVPPGADPAYWIPSPETIAAYQDADLVLLNGAGYASWIARASLPESRLVHTSAAFSDLYIRMDESVVHTHGPGGDHEHANTAFTTWLDPLLAIEQARAIRDALAAADPRSADTFEVGFRALEEDLSGLDERLERWAEGRSGVPLLASHPVYPYLARRYGLDLRSVHFEPEVEPSAEGWRDLAELVRERPARWMLSEGPPLEVTADRLASDFGIGVVVFDPCGNRPTAGDYLSVMRGNVESLEALTGK